MKYINLGRSFHLPPAPLPSSITFILLALIATNDLTAQNQPLRSFPLSAVRLLESPFYQAQRTDMKYILALDPDRLLAPFQIDAAVTPKAKGYGNWEGTGLNGHIGGHYLSALSFMYAATGNGELLRRLNHMLDSLAECQEKNGNGYVGGIPNGKKLWLEIAAGKINADNFSLNGQWVPLYNIHKLFAGLRDAYAVAGSKKALALLVKLTDWFLQTTNGLTDAQVERMLISEHGGLNEVFADVYEIQKDEKYLTLARRFSHKLILNRLKAKRNVLTGLHANMTIPKVTGYKRIADLTGDQEWAVAADFFWDLVVRSWTVSIGGNSVSEHFNPINNFSSMIESVEGPETCNTNNMLRLTKLLFLSNPSGAYLDYYERALYNHILSSQHPEKGGFVYFTPLRPRHYRVYSQPQEGFWCCVGTGLENHGKYGELIYAHGGNDLFVNLFIPSVLTWKEKGLTLTQKTKFPDAETCELRLTLGKRQKFSLHIRRPEWVGDADMNIRLNGKPIAVTAASSSYLSINSTWKSGDTVTFVLPRRLKVEYLPDKSSWASILYGPIALAAATGTEDLTGLWANDGRMAHVPSGPRYPKDEAPAIISDESDFSASIRPVKGKTLAFIMPDIIDAPEFKNLELVPFFRIHEARYIIYWQVKKKTP